MTFTIETSGRKIRSNATGDVSLHQAYSCKVKSMLRRFCFESRRKKTSKVKEGNYNDSKSAFLLELARK